MSAEEQCVITDICCRRAVYCIQGYSKNKTECRLFFMQSQKQMVVEPTHVKWGDGHFVLYLNTETADKQYPLQSGEYMLLSGNLPDPQPVRMDPAVSGQYAMRRDIHIYKNRFHYLDCYSGMETGNGGFFLKVDAALPQKRRYFKEGEVKENGLYPADTLKDAAEGLFRLVFRIIKLLTRRNGRTILFTSGSRAEIGGNEAFIYNRMTERGLDKEYTILFDFKESIRKRKTPLEMIAFLRKLAAADIILVDDYYPEICKLEFDKDVKVFQVWHACGAFKTVGLERLDKKGAPPINSKAHKCYTHVPVSSELAALHCQESFGIDYAKIYPVGVPRTDIFFDEAYKARVCREVYRRFPKAEEARKVFLYAPTFRGDSALDAGFPMDSIDLEKWGQLCRERGDYLIIKMHPFVREQVYIPEMYRDVIADASSFREINDLLFIADVLITDYSSVIYEFSLLRRPCLMYAFDLEEYEAERDFYESYEDTVPGPILRTFDELIDYIKRDVYDREGLERFIRKNFTYTDGRSTDRVIDLMLKG